MKNLILYYSWGGNTKKIAECIQSKVGGDLFEIKTLEPYSSTYALCVAQAGKEIFLHSHRPIVAVPEKLEDYDKVYLGTPVWWHGWALPMLVALKKLNFAGKTLLPFCTHGGGGASGLDKDLAKLQPEATITAPLVVLKDDGEMLEADVAAWLSGVNK